VSGRSRTKLKARLQFEKQITRSVDRVGAWGVHLSRLAGAFVALAVFILALAVASIAAAEPCPPTLVERQRYGFVGTQDNWSQTFDFDQLGAGWYVDSWPYSEPPDGMDRALVIGTYPSYTIDPSALGSLVDSHPGVLWLVGSEPDCIWQDNVLPEEYARIYHDLYYFIKNRDRTSQVAAGGIVQPTPLRLEYLDRVLAAYRARYGHAMPVDVWHIHNAILNEVRGGWGADIPPGSEATQGAIRSVDENDNMDIFRGQIWAFRQWMAGRGYRGYPLVVTEYGILLPEILGYDEGRVNAFMSNTFNFLSNSTDGVLGDPTDDHRLVQRWAWFSLDYPPFDPITWQGFNGSLFDSDTAAITDFGQHYAGHTAPFPPLAYADLGLGAWDTPPPPLVVSPTEVISYSLRVRIVNRGTVASGSFTVTLAHDGPVSGTHAQVVANLPPVSSQWLTFTLADLQMGAYTLSLEIDPGDQVSDTARCNNQATRIIVVPAYRSYLPNVAGRSSTTMLGQGTVATRSGPPKNGMEIPLQARRLPPVNDRGGFREFEMPTADSYPAQIALDPARPVLWITERDGNKLACFDPQSEAWCPEPEYDIPTTDSQPWGLAIDGVGNVWFAESAADKIGVVDLATGIISEPVRLRHGSQPWGVAISGTGVDTAVWFTERAGNRIGKYVPATGDLVEYDVPTSGALPSGVDTTGDFVFFSEPAVNRLGRLWISREELRDFAPYPPSPPLGRPEDVAVITHDSLWFTEMDGDKITAYNWGTVQAFHPIPVETANSEPYGIAVEGIKAVWFTERAANRVGRYVGELPPREYLLPTPGSLPTDLVVDGDGCAWYTAPGANQIGRLCLPFPFQTYLPLVLKSQSQVFER
jgi:streptogramin lyase